MKRLLLSVFLINTAAAQDTLESSLETIRKKYSLPALSGILIKNGKADKIITTGVRRIGHQEPITPKDRWHIGSITKSMTATLIAKLVDENKLSWDTTIQETFPALKLDPAYQKVTLEQLLAHRGGLPTAIPEKIWEKAWERKGTPTEQRMTLLSAMLTLAPEAKPGTKFIYSNTGYAIAGAMAEKVTGKSWEELMQAYVFLPLKMDSAGFGAPGNAQKTDQPWGHRMENGQAVAVPPGPEADNPPAIGPAATVHASLEDLAKYAEFHLKQPFPKLYAPQPGQDYVLGWIRVEREWAKGFALTHGGSNTMWYAVVWLAPKRNLGIIVTTNVGGEAAAKACDEAASALLTNLLEEK